MSNDFIEELKKLINFGIDGGEILSFEERKERMSSFRNDLSVDKYMNLFLSISNYLLSSEVSSLEKDEVIKYLLGFIRNFSIIENNISKLPVVIQNLYNSHINLFDILLAFDYIYTNDYTAIKFFEDTMLRYLDFLENPINEFYINNYFSYISKFNNKIIDYLNKVDINGIKHSDNIGDSKIIELLNKKIDELIKNRS